MHFCILLQNPHPMHFFFLIYILTNQSKIRLLREEVREHDTREQRLRMQHKHTRAELKALRQTRGTERDAFLQRLDEQEKLLLCISTEKQGTKSQHCYCFSARSLLLAAVLLKAIRRDSFLSLKKKNGSPLNADLCPKSTVTFVSYLALAEVHIFCGGWYLMLRMVNGDIFIWLHEFRMNKKCTFKEFHSFLIKHQKIYK